MANKLKTTGWGVLQQISKHAIPNLIRESNARKELAIRAADNAGSDEEKILILDPLAAPKADSPKDWITKFQCERYEDLAGLLARGLTTMHQIHEECTWAHNENDLAVCILQLLLRCNPHQPVVIGPDCCKPLMLLPKPTNVRLQEQRYEVNESNAVPTLGYPVHIDQVLDQAKDASKLDVHHPRGTTQCTSANSFRYKYGTPIELLTSQCDYHVDGQYFKTKEGSLLVTQEQVGFPQSYSGKWYNPATEQEVEPKYTVVEIGMSMTQCLIMLMTGNVYRSASSASLKEAWKSLMTLDEFSGPINEINHTFKSQYPEQYNKLFKSDDECINYLIDYGVNFFSYMVTTADQYPLNLTYGQGEEILKGHHFGYRCIVQLLIKTNTHLGYKP